MAADQSLSIHHSPPALESCRSIMQDSSSVDSVLHSLCGQKRRQSTVQIQDLSDDSSEKDTHATSSSGPDTVWPLYHYFTNVMSGEVYISIEDRIAPYLNRRYKIAFFSPQNDLIQFFFLYFINLTVN